METTQWWLVMSSPSPETKLPEQPGSCTAFESSPVPFFLSQSLASGSANPCCLTQAGPSSSTCWGVHLPSAAKAETESNSDKAITVPMTTVLRRSEAEPEGVGRRP